MLVTWGILFSKVKQRGLMERIDAEIRKLEAEGKTPKIIYVGLELYLKLEAEVNPPFAADLLSEGQRAADPPPLVSPDEYKGIKVSYQDWQPNDYLYIETNE
jgi:hypothetical protein